MTVVAVGVTVAYLLLAIAGGGGGFAAFFSNPARIALTSRPFSLPRETCKCYYLHNDPAIEPLDGCQLTLQLYDADLGIIRQGQSAFVCAPSVPLS
jgi:hypothetical protein